MRKIWPAHNSRLTQHETNHYIARCATDAIWIKSGSNRDQIGIKSGSNRNQIGIKLGLNRDKIGIKIWIKYGSNLDQIWIKLDQIWGKSGGNQEEGT